MPTGEDIRKIVDKYLKNFKEENSYKEIAFFGGSFTGIPIEEQKAFLAVAKEYKDAAKIDKIHLSTRPDYIDTDILDNLRAYSVDVIELGVQSMDENVLMLSERGHTADDVYKACDLIKSYGCFTLGIQLMIGLPGDSYESCMMSALKTIEIGPQIARLYPTVVISGTKLCRMYEEGAYRPFSPEEMLRTTTDMYKALTDAGINVIRVGLKASALINDSDDSRVVGGTYHPAFRQLVEGRIAREEIENRLAVLSDDLHLQPYDEQNKQINIIITSGSNRFSAVIGHKAANKQYFDNRFPQFLISYREDPSLQDGRITVKVIRAQE